MEYLQYTGLIFNLTTMNLIGSFKPCYKWNTFNTVVAEPVTVNTVEVLNLVINGIPSIQFLFAFG